MAKCPMCDGKGKIDSGGSTPQGHFIEVPCDFCLGQGAISDGELKAYHDAWKAAEHLASQRDEPLPRWMEENP